MSTRRLTARVRTVRLAAAGFVVSWHPAAQPSDVHASVLDPARMPRGHELLRECAEVDLELDAAGKIVAARRPRPAWFRWPLA